MAAMLVSPPPPPPPQLLTARPHSPGFELQKAALYVGDLDPEVSEIDLIAVFSEMGSLVSVRLCRDSLSGKSLCYGYVNFFDSSDASKALACLNHTKLNGKPMRIMWSHRDPLPRKTGLANLFVKNLNPSINSASLQKIFCKFGNILSCKVAEENGKSKCFGFVQFDSDDSATAALNALHDTMHEGKKLYVSKFVKKSERKEASGETTFTNVYVKNLGEDFTEDLLREKFSEFGKVGTVFIMKDGNGKSRGFGFVNFELPDDAKKAVEALNGAMLGSKKLFVGKAQKKAERQELLKQEEVVNCNIGNQNASNLYVKNLDASVDDNKLQGYFSSCGQITSAKVMRHDSGISKGFGFVCFSTSEEAQRALATLNGTLFHGKSLYIAMAQRKEDRQRILRDYYSQHFSQYYGSHWDVLSPGSISPDYSFVPFPRPNPTTPLNNSPRSITCQQFSRNIGVMRPFPPQHYQQSFSTFIPMKQVQHGSINSWGYQQNYRTFASSKVSAQGLNNAYHPNQKHYLKKKGNNNKSGSEEASSNGSISVKYSVRAPTVWGSSKKIIGDQLYPRVKNLQPELAGKITGMLLEMNNSDLIELLDSPDSLTSQVEEAVQVLKEAKAQKSTDCSASLPVVESATGSCLSC